MKRLLLLVWVAAAAAAAAGGEEALPDGQEMPPAWSPVPGRAEEGKVAFMGFDFGKEVEWEPEEHFVFDAWPGRYLARKFALETPWHGFESVEAWGDVETRLPMALVFERDVPDGSMEDAESWMAEMVPAFPKECGMELRRQDCGGPCLEARGMMGELVAWVCAGGYSLSRPVGESDSGLPVWETEEGVSYQVRIRRVEVRMTPPETPVPDAGRAPAAAKTFIGTAPTRYEIGSGDDGGTLSGVARLFYGRASDWPYVFEANRGILDDPDLIRPGMVLEIPDPHAADHARFLALYRAFLDAPSERTLLDLLVDAVDAGSFGPPPPEIRAFLLEQLSQNPPPVYRVDLGDAPEIDAWTVAHACAESLFSGIPSPSGPGSVVAICSRRRGEDVFRFHLCRIPPSLLPALRAAIAGPATPE